jgi:hypothetical protein
VLGRGQHPKDTEHMKALALATAVDSDDGEEPPCHHAKRVPKLKASAPIGMSNPFEPFDIEESNADNDDFIATSSESLEESTDIEELTNAEVVYSSYSIQSMLTDEQ